ncbi:MAG: hypothetical protein ACT4TC_01935 [Myxococcaceae bacterium]
MPLVVSVLPLSPHYEEARQHPFEAAVQYTVDYHRTALKAPAIPSRVVYGFLPYWVQTDPNRFRWDVLTHVIYFSAELSEIGDIKNTHGLFNASGRSPIVEIAHRNGPQGADLLLCPGRSRRALASAPPPCERDSEDDRPGAERRRGRDGH